MFIEVTPSQTFVYQQWVQGLNDSCEVFRRLADWQLQLVELTLNLGAASLESFQSVLRVAFDEDIAGKLLGQPLRQAMTAIAQAASHAPASGHAAMVPVAK